MSLLQIFVGSCPDPKGLAIADILTSASILVACVTAIFTFHQNRTLARRSHTLDVSLEKLTGEEDAEFQTYMNSLIVSDNIPDGSTRDPKIAKILTVYEFIALASRKNALDWKLIVEIRGPLLARVYRQLEGYISRQRDEAQNPMLYEHYEWLVTKKIEPELARRGVSLSAPKLSARILPPAAVPPHGPAAIDEQHEDNREA
jgi:hypothetical protein